MVFCPKPNVVNAVMRDVGHMLKHWLLGLRRLTAVPLEA
jgi:hypothetical protein